MHTQPLDTFLQDLPSHSHQDWSWSNQIRHRIHFFEFESYTVWGLTANILIHVAQIALQRSAAFDITAAGMRPFSDVWHDGQQVLYR